MRLTPIPRRAGTLAVAVAAGLLSTACPAEADVTVNPPAAERGAGVNETFRVVNEHPTAAMTKIRLLLPAATPVAEVYPLSVPDWAPQITTRKVNPPMLSMHGGAPVSEATASITWTAAPGKALRPGKAADVMIAIGPLPQTERMIFQVEATYAGKATGPAIAPVVLTLTPPAAAPAHAIGKVHASEGADVESSAAAQGGSGLAAAGWIVAVMLAAAGAVARVRARHRSDEADGSDPAPGDPTQPGGAGPTDASDPVEDVPTHNPAVTAPQTRATAWSYRDGP